MPLDEKFRMNFANRRAEIISAGGPDRIEERHNKGLMTARERLAALFQEDTFQEYGAHIRHGATAFGMAELEVPSDGVVVGTGYVAGRQVAAFSQDFMVMGGTLGKMHARKIVWAQDYALKNGTPLIGFKDSGGARIQEGVEFFVRIRRGVLSQCRAVGRRAADRHHRRPYAPAARPTRRR